MKNRRADIPIVILVIGVVAICGLAILSFIVSDKVNVNPKKLGLEVFEQVHSDVEKFEFYKNAGKTYEEASDLIGADSFSGNVLIIKDRKDDLRKIEIVEYKYVIK